MNPKDINNLDPKLKETYDRVMGTSLGTSPTPPVMTTQQTPGPQPVTQPAPEQSPKPQMQVERPPTASTNEGTTVSQVFRSDNQNKTHEPTTVSSPSFKKAASTKTNINKLLPIIVVVAIVFFIIYGVVWAKLLGLF